MNPNATGGPPTRSRLEASFPVSVIMRCEWARHRLWCYPRWSLLAVTAGQDGSPPGRTLLHQQGDAVDYRWDGMSVRLTRSGAETYWFNLISSRPSLFVVCREDPESGLAPVSVTVDQDSASRQSEGDGEVFPAPLPAPMIPWLEKFVMAHYQPRERGRRRRKPLDRNEGSG